MGNIYLRTTAFFLFLFFFFGLSYILLHFFLYAYENELAKIYLNDLFIA